MAMQIELTNKRDAFALIDEDDFQLVRGKRLFLMGGYVCTSCNRQPVKLHRLILSPPANMVVDHINGDPLDNRKENLRVCTNAQNIRNSRKPVDGKSSRYKGVCWVPSRSRWSAKIMVSGVRISIGYFKSEDEAGSAYNSFASYLYGEYARLNAVEPRLADIDVSAVLRQRATGVRRDSKTGVPGITLEAGPNPWRVNHKGKYLGVYETLDRAIEVKRMAASQCIPGT